jgi:hypothetical protein
VGGHDVYGKRVLRSAAGDAFSDSGAPCRVDLGAGPGGAIDGVVAPDIAVEIEARVAKQIRGALLDLICHPLPKKLLVIIPAHAQNPDLTAKQCRFILRRFVDDDAFRVVVLAGTGINERLEEDVELVRASLEELTAARLREHPQNIQAPPAEVNAQVSTVIQDASD